MKKFFHSGLASAVALLASAPAFAEEAAGGAHSGGGMYALAAALAIGIAAAGGAIGQGRAAAAALEGIARNPAAKDKIQTPMIIGLALIESLVIYSLVIAFIISGKA
jgi:F-type H+-transporting ATPase subunit c